MKHFYLALIALLGITSNLLGAEVIERAELPALRQTETSSPHQYTSIKHLLELISHRMHLMEEVAAWKLDHNIPIEDKSQEARVLEASMEQAEAAGLNGSSTRHFFELQIALAKQIQNGLQTAWKDAGLNKAPYPYRDLHKELRPEIAKTNQEIIWAIEKTLPRIHDKSFYSKNLQEAENQISAPFISNYDRHAIIAALVHIQNAS